mgnify:CR=1 FL=1
MKQNKVELNKYEIDKVVGGSLCECLINYTKHCDTDTPSAELCGIYCCQVTLGHGHTDWDWHNSPNIIHGNC